MTDERRHHERYNNERLVLKVTRPGIRGFLRLNPTANCLDYSRSGLQFASDQPMHPGQPLVLDIQVYDLELSEIYGEIISCVEEESGKWCCRVEFSRTNSQMQKSEFKRGLLMIEDKLRTLSLFPEPTTQTAV